MSSFKDSKQFIENIELIPESLSELTEYLNKLFCFFVKVNITLEAQEKYILKEKFIEIIKMQRARYSEELKDTKNNTLATITGKIIKALGDTPVQAVVGNICKNIQPLEVEEKKEQDITILPTAEEQAIYHLKKEKEKRKKLWEELNNLSMSLYNIHLQKKLLQINIKRKQNELDGAMGVMGRRGRLNLEAEKRQMEQKLDDKNWDFQEQRNEAKDIAKKIRDKRKGGEAIVSFGEKDDSPLANELVKIPLKGRGTITYRVSVEENDLPNPLFKPVIPRGGRRKNQKKKKEKKEKKNKEKKKKNA